MRALLASIVLSAIPLCGPALAAESVVSPNDEIVPVVSPGQQIGIACDALDVAQSNSDVRVVLTVSAIPDGSAPSKVLATDQKLGKGAVSVKVPNTPNIANHTYDLNVYVLDKRGTQTCDAGHLKIQQQMSELLEKSGSKHG